MKTHFSVSLPVQVVERIEKQRGELTRSGYIAQLIETAIQEPQTEEEQ